MKKYAITISRGLTISDEMAVKCFNKVFKKGWDIKRHYPTGALVDPLALIFRTCIITGELKKGKKMPFLGLQGLTIQELEDKK